MELCCPVSPWQHCPVLSNFYNLLVLPTLRIYTTPDPKSPCELTIQSNFIELLHFLLHYLYKYSLHNCIFTAYLSFLSLVAEYLQLFELPMLNVFITMLLNRIAKAMCLHNTL